MCLRGGVLILLGLAAVSEAVKVNMMGSLSLGSEVLEALADYVKENLVDFKNGRKIMTRRKMSADLENTITNAKLCKDIVFCHGDLKNIVNDYVIHLSRAISDVFDNTLQGGTFDGEAKKYLKDVKKFLRHASSKYTEEAKVHVWSDVLKKISSSLLERATEFMAERLDSSEPKTELVIKLLTQHLVLAVATVEYEHQTKLCGLHNICGTKLDCSKSLNYVLDSMKKIDDDKARAFIKAFYHYAADSAVFLRLDNPTKKRLEEIFKDMYSDYDTAPTRDILKSIKNVIRDRIAGKSGEGNDVLLIMVILSDLDYVYDDKKDPFEGFLKKYDEWVTSKDSKDIKYAVKEVLEELTAHLSEQPREVIFKLMSEVRVFLEITVDPVPQR